MAQYVPLYRPSFASLEDDRFFSACSSQPASRLMSVFTPQEKEQLGEGTNSTARPSEPLASVCLPSVESTLPSSREQSPVPAPLADSHSHVPQDHHFLPTSIRGQSKQSKAEEPPAETDIAHYDRLPLVSRAQLDGHVSKEEVDNILRSVCGYLSARQHRDRYGKLVGPTATETRMPLSPLQTLSDSPHLETQTQVLPEDQFVVTTDDIIGILDIVIARMRKFQNDAIQPSCQSLLFPNNINVKPILRARSIIIGPSAVADPATTICLPRPCFNWADSPEVFRHPSPTAVTTYGIGKL
ncbi:hypothetical protein F4859DRAFT_528885 [Xylaria cf. heliscus]|nr:hypothetical protein F4859DRAFT_528885 [Xylaria cf. heliscus]